ncbi:uncharacterized protein LOC132267514 [Cornus florida]|uniref:uncharacterized protein LOC132267514 n=1 Tax=Cornus florida TaxID=4283 RepID=UPI0028A06348|nr:uncharacterized protein LOC132267514 [Cornus florida]
MVSDHITILLDCGGVRRRRTPFCFENMWLRLWDFKERVHYWWTGYEVRRNPSFRLASKIMLLKGDLKKWNKEVFGNLIWRKNRIIQKIVDIDKKEGKGFLSATDSNRWAECKVEFGETVMMEEIYWRQKSRALWLTEGDRNRLANAHRRGNHISRICFDGNMVTRDEDVQAGFVAILDGLEFDEISSEDKEWLERPFREEEVLEALRSCEGDKAPRPDGFTLAFFQHNWEVVKPDVMGALSSFFSDGVFEKSLNASFIDLIPKKSVVFDVKDFRPISLMGVIYKIFSTY